MGQSWWTMPDMGHMINAIMSHVTHYCTSSASAKPDCMVRHSHRADSLSGWHSKSRETDVELNSNL